MKTTERRIGRKRTRMKISGRRITSKMKTKRWRTR